MDFSETLLQAGKGGMPMMGPGLMRDMYGGMGIWMVLNFLFLLLLIAGIVLLIVWLVRRSERDSHGRLEESAMEILKRRYARGEISKEEYERMRKDLS